MNIIVLNFNKQKLLSKFLNVIYFLIPFSSHSQGFVWAKAMGGTGDDIGYSITTDAAGNILTCGSFSSIVDFDPGPGQLNLTSSGSDDIFISKIDASGNFLWAKRIGGTLPDVAYSIQTDISGNVYTTGTFAGTVDFDPGPSSFTLASTFGNGNSSIFISKLDASGNFVWAKKMGGAGGLFSDTGNGIYIDATGNIYCTGMFNLSSDFDPGPGTFSLTSSNALDIFISKLDASGNFLWAKSFGGTGGDDIGLSITTDNSGNVYTVGNFQGTVDFDPGAGVFNLISAGVQDIFISKLDASGNFIWAERMGGPYFDEARSIIINPLGEIYTTGNFGGTADFDPGPAVYNLIPGGGYISKLDASGNFIWANKIGGQNANSVSLDGAGNIYSTGYFGFGMIGPIDFDPGPGVFNLTASNYSDIFILKLDASGNFLCAGALGGTSHDRGLAIRADASGNIYTTGYFAVTSDFDPGASVFNIASAAANDVFISKLTQTCSLVGLSENQFNFKEVNIYPNPFNNVIEIKSTGIKESVRIYNALGSLVYSSIIEQEKKEIDLSEIVSGIYFVKIGLISKIIVKQE